MSAYGSECHEGVTRRGTFEPCDKPAVAFRVDPEEGAPYPVCAFHAREQMVPLLDVPEVLRRG